MQFTSKVGRAAVRALLGLVVAAAAAPVAHAQQWVQVTKAAPVPAGTVQVGREANGRPIHVCRAMVGTNKLPGKRLRDGVCAVAANGQIHEFDSYELLRAAAGEWISPRELTAAPMVAGTENGRSVPLCRVDYENGVHPGRVTAGMCHFAYADTELQAEEFQVLALAAVQPSAASAAGASSTNPLSKVGVVAGRPGTTATGPAPATWPGNAGATWVDWSAAKGNPPPGNFNVAGSGGVPMFPCRGAFHNNVLIGWRAGDGRCLAAFNNRTETLAPYQLLTRSTGRFVWRPADVRPALVGGLVNGQPATLCRVNQSGTIYPGYTVIAGGVNPGTCHVVTNRGAANAFPGAELLLIPTP